MFRELRNMMVFFRRMLSLVGGLMVFSIIGLALSVQGTDTAMDETRLFVAAVLTLLFMLHLLDWVLLLFILGLMAAIFAENIVVTLTILASMTIVITLHCVFADRRERENCTWSAINVFHPFERYYFDTSGDFHIKNGILSDIFGRHRIININAFTLSMKNRRSKLILSDVTIRLRHDDRLPDDSEITFGNMRNVRAEQLLHILNGHY